MRYHPDHTTKRHTSAPRVEALDAEALHQLPAVVNLVTAARALGVGRTVAYELVRAGTWPTPVLRLGHQIKIPTAALLALLGLSPSAEARADPAGDGEHDDEMPAAKGRAVGERSRL